MEEKQIEEILKHYSGKGTLPQEEIVEMLREIQETLGCIPDDVRERVAQAAQVKPSVVELIMKWYPSLKRAPYRHRILVCCGKSCGGRGIENYDWLKRKLQVGNDGISADGTIKVETIHCLKQCKYGPNVMIDGKIHQAVTKEKLKKLITEIRGIA